MKSLIENFLRAAVALIVVSLFSLRGVEAQNVVVSGAMTGNGSYGNLTAAFAAINAGGQGGANILVTVVNNTSELTGTAILNQSVAPWTSLTVQPSGGSWTVSGVTLAGQPMVDLRGADDVVIDGLNSSGNALTFQNLQTSSVAGTSTIQFSSDARHNVVTRCTIQGSGTTTLANAGGVVVFGAGVTNGNDNNIVSYCDIGPAGTNLPTKSVGFYGTNGTFPQYNDSCQVLNCNIFDYFSATVASAGVVVQSGTLTVYINNNHFYQTAARTQTTGSIHSAIEFNHNGAVGCHIFGNTIGGANASGTGTYTFAGTGASKFYPIYVTGMSNVSTTTFDGNTIQNIAISGGMGGTTTTSPFVGIFITVGDVDINNNVIGSQTTNGSISFTTGGSASEIVGIYMTNVYMSSSIYMNTVAGITMTATGTIPKLVFYGIRITGAATYFSIIDNNQLGGPLANSIQITAGGAASATYGIYLNSTHGYIDYNIIRNFANPASGGVITGIFVNSSSHHYSMNYNQISDFYLTHPTAAATISGIDLGSSLTTNSASYNFIHSFSSPSTTAAITGIYDQSAGGTFTNNMIRLGIDGSGASVTTGCSFVGINSYLIPASNYYHNTVYIGGSGVTGSNSTYALNSSQPTSTRRFKNNIFYNARSNGTGTGKHYAIRLGGTGPNPTGLTSDYNLLAVTGTGGMLGYYGNADQPSILFLSSVTGQDIHSIGGNPNFVNPTGASAAVNLHIAIPSPIDAAGSLVSTVTDDYDQEDRSLLSPVDIGADAGNFAPDLTPPAISYSALVGSCSTGDRTLSATITDASGIPTTGTLQPRIYFRKNLGSYFSSQGVLSSGSATNGNWTFTISASAMGGLTGGDVVDYYVIAQDISSPSPNIASNPSAGLVATNVNTVTSPPSSPNNFTVTPSVTPSVSIAANPGTTICNATSVLFAATPVNGGTTPAYQWFKNGSPVGTNSSSLTDNLLLNGDVITCELTSNAACASPALVTSNALTITVNAIPAAPTAGSNSPVLVGGTINLTASTVTGATYAWTGPNGFTSTQQNPSIPVATLPMGGTYTVTVTVNGCTSSGGTTLVTVIPSSTLSGTILHPNGTATIRTTTVALTGTTTNSMVTGTNGQYSFTGLTPGDSCVLTPSKANDSTTNNGITTLDLVLMQQHVLNQSLLNSPYKILAADVNNSASVTTLDIVLTRTVILQTNPTFPGGRLWYMVDKDFVFADPQNPWPYPNTRTYPNVSTQVNQDFYGIKMGDVNWSWNPATPKMAPQHGMDVYFGNFSGKVGEMVTVPVKVEKFHGIAGYQFTLVWDKSVLELVGADGIATAAWFGESKAMDGVLTVSWNDEAGGFLELPDGSTLFNLHFRVVGEVGANTQLTVNGNAIAAEAYDKNLDLLTVKSNDGGFKVVGDQGTNPSDKFIIWHPSFPNPFHQETTITFELYESRPMRVTITDLRGTIVGAYAGVFDRGLNEIKWDGKNDSGEAVAAGTYLMRMEAGSEQMTYRLMYVKE